MSELEPRVAIDAEPGGATAPGGESNVLFILYALVSLGMVLVLNWMIVNVAPFSVKGMGPFYLVFYYHLPAALSCYLFFVIAAVFSALYLIQGKPAWDQRARVAAEVGLLGCLVCVVTGAIWAKSAWGHWWVFDDPRLVSASIMCLIYAGYVMLQTQLDNPHQRRRYCAVLGILAVLCIPFVNKAPEWFGTGNHPSNMNWEKTPGGQVTQWYGVLAFLSFYLLLYWWKLSREKLRDDVEECLRVVRNLEEGR